MRIAVLYSLPTKRAIASPYKSTDEDTKDSAEEVAAAILGKGGQSFLVPVHEDGIDAISSIKADCIFNLIEWDGFDLPLARMVYTRLEAAHIPFTGSRIGVFDRTSDKVGMKHAMDKAGIPTPRWQVFETGKESVRPDFHYPVIVKLALEHCSIGLTKDAVVRDSLALVPVVQERIRVFGQPVIVEEYIGGREFQVTLLSRKDGWAVLPASEIMFDHQGKEDAFLTFNSRWNEEHAEYSLSHVKLALLAPAFSVNLDRIAWACMRTFEFCDYARLDIRSRGEDIFVLEANANPGLGDSDEYGMTVSYKAVGLSFADFIWEIVASSLRRFMA
ncbi:hypothetical protein HY948_00240 [Candidatus Gottesmanbacteria bacterium]|nr:hypothetical protein [Candidatus Gottesmanbacteria bacterium]